MKFARSDVSSFPSPLPPHSCARAVRSLLPGLIALVTVLAGGFAPAASLSAPDHAEHTDHADASHDGTPPEANVTTATSRTDDDIVPTAWNEGAPCVDCGPTVGSLLSGTSLALGGNGSGYPSVRVTGLFQADSVWFGQDAASTAAVGDISDFTDFRRARLAATGHVAENVNYMIEFDFGFPGRPTFMDVYATVEELPVLGNVRVGQWRQPFAMDAMTSVRELWFLERATAFTFFPFRKTGIGAFNTAFDEQMTWAASAFRYPADQFGGSFGDSGYGMSTRITGLLLDHGDDGLIHAGFNFAHLQPSTHQFRFRTTPEIGFTAGDINGGPTVVPFFVDTGAIPSQSAQMLGTELAGQVLGITLQSELFYALVNQEGGPSLAFPAMYAQASYALTGERRSYNRKQGVFGRIIPHHNFGAGHWGAWELAARWSWIDLNDANIQGGELTDLTFGVNWYLNRYFKTQFNYIHAFLNSPGMGDSGTDIVAVRAQIDF